MCIYSEAFKSIYSIFSIFSLLRVGLRYADYLQLCQEQFAAHDDARLRKYLTEYSDHKLVAVRVVSLQKWL